MIVLRGHHLDIFYGYVRYKRNEIRIGLKDIAIMRNNPKKHGQNIIKVMKKALNPNEKIKLIDTLDDVCFTCKNKNKKECREFIKHSVSVASVDRITIDFYGFKLGKTYTSKYVQRRLNEKKDSIYFIM